MGMSDINDLIARSGQISYETGVNSERRRIIKILEGLPAEFSHNGYTIRTVRTAIKRIEEAPSANTSKTE
jgi:hypothetical protein